RRAPPRQSESAMAGSALRVSRAARRAARPGLAVRRAVLNIYFFGGVPVSPAMQRFVKLGATRPPANPDLESGMQKALLTTGPQLETEPPATDAEYIWRFGSVVFDEGRWELRVANNVAEIEP